MNRGTKTILAVAIFTCFIALFVVWRNHSSQPTEESSPRPQETRTLSSSSPQQPTKSGDELTKSMLSSVLDSMKAAGGITGSPSVKKLREAVDSGEPTQIREAFAEAPFDRFTKSNELSSELQKYLQSESPLVRMLAAKALYVIGQREGATPLIGIVESATPLESSDHDLRIEAAKILAQYREDRGASSILNLYQETKGSGLLSALALLNYDEAIPDLERNGFYGNEHSIERYGMLRATSFIPKLAQVFSESSDAETRIAAAWALARMTNEAKYIDFLVKQSQSAISANPKSGSVEFDESTLALKYLGSLQTDEAKQTLKTALNSDNPAAVRFGVVNLLFNQGEAKEAEDVLVRELNGDQNMLSTELLLNISSKSDSAKVLAAGENFAQRTSEGDWNLYRNKRKAWPIYNWIDDYVVVVNEAP